MKASMEYMASGDLGPLQPDTPQNSMRSLLNALLLKQAPNQVDTHVHSQSCRLYNADSTFMQLPAQHIQQTQELQLQPQPQPLSDCLSNIAASDVACA